MSDRVRVAVVGGGIAGLAAAWFLRRDCPAGTDLDVTVLEASPQVGGKLRTSDVGGVSVDEGAESMLARRHEGLELAAAVGLADDVVHPGVEGASVWSRGALRPLPTGQLMGIPADLRSLAASEVVSLAGLMRVPLDHWLPRTPVDGDISVGSYVAARLGPEVVDRLVEPLLGGVYAGHANQISLAASLPQVDAGVRFERSLLRVVQQSLPPRPMAPVFASLRGGLGRLAPAVAAASQAHVRTGSTVRDLRRSTDGWRLVVGSTTSPEIVAADAVVVALPATPAARLLAHEVPIASVELAAVESASVAIVTALLPRATRRAHVRGTGFLVPPVEDRLLKAATDASRKWTWLDDLDPEHQVVRLSVGRHGEEHDLQLDDDDLAAAALADFASMTGWGGRAAATRVTRWGGGLPQYAVGHLDRVARIRSAVAEQPGLAVCGATYDGVGIPACVASAERAAAQVLRGLGERRQWRHG